MYMAQDVITFTEFRGSPAEKVFPEGSPRSRVKKDIIEEIKEDINRAPYIDHPCYVNYKGVKEIEGELYLLREDRTESNNFPEEERPFSVYLNKEDLSLEKALSWAQKIIEMGQIAEENNHTWQGITLNSLRINSRGELRLLPPGIVRTIHQYRSDMDPLIDSENYLPPEVIERGSWTTEGVLYSFGVLLYFLLTGQAPYSGNSRADTYDKILASSYIKPRYLNPEIAPDLNEIIVKLLYRNKKQRYHSWESLGQEIRAIITENRYQASRISYKKNEIYSKVITNYVKSRDRVTFAIKRRWKFIAAASVLVLMLFLLNTMSGNQEAVTSQTSPREVVEIFYESLHNKDEDNFGAASSIDPGNLERLMPEVYIMENMQQYNRGMPIGTDMGEKDEEEMIYGLKEIEITEVAEKPQPEFKVEYIFFFNEELEQKPGKKTETHEMEDHLYLEKIDDVWQITKIDGDLNDLISGDLSFNTGGM